jgi:hypothetical protein
VKRLGDTPDRVVGSTIDVGLRRPPRRGRRALPVTYKLGEFKHEAVKQHLETSGRVYSQSLSGDFRPDCRVF